MVNCFRISDTRQLTPCDFESAAQATRNVNSCVWIDIQDVETVELEEKLEKLDVKGLGRRLCLEARDRPGYYPISNLTFLVIPVLATAGDFHVVEHVAFLARKNLLLTLRDARAVRLYRTITLQESADWLPDVSVVGLVASFMIALSLESLKRMSELRDSIIILEERMDRKADSVKMKEISHKRSELLTLESVVSGQLPVIQALIASDRASLKLESIREYFICAVANLQAIDRSLDWLEGRIDVIRSMVDMQAQDRTNRRLGRLTIVSVIFLPMTFLAGIWGMNFEHMPGLKNPIGYPIALASMLLIAVGIYFYFRWKGWLD